MNFAGSETVSANGGVVLNATFNLTAGGTATISTEKFKLADIDTNYLTCADSTKDITITNGNISNSITPKITAENGVVIKFADREISLIVGEAKAIVDGKAVELDVASFIDNSRTYLPIRFITENIGFDVDWEGEAQKVIITKAN